jgi:hypothetical protein
MNSSNNDDNLNINASQAGAYQELPPLSPSSILNDALNGEMEWFTEPMDYEKVTVQEKVNNNLQTPVKPLFQVQTPQVKAPVQNIPTTCSGVKSTRKRARSLMPGEGKSCPSIPNRECYNTIPWESTLCSDCANVQKGRERRLRIKLRYEQDPRSKELAAATAWVRTRTSELTEEAELQLHANNQLKRACNDITRHERRWEKVANSKAEFELRAKRVDEWIKKAQHAPGSQL